MTLSRILREVNRAYYHFHNIECVNYSDFNHLKKTVYPSKVGKMQEFCLKAQPVISKPTIYDNITGDIQADIALRDNLEVTAAGSCVAYPFLLRRPSSTPTRHGTFLIQVAFNVCMQMRRSAHYAKKRVSDFATIQKRIVRGEKCLNPKQSVYG